MSLLSLFQWCEATAVAVAIRESLWLFPAIESLHLLALALGGGCVILVDLHLLGLRFRDQNAAELQTAVLTTLYSALAVMIVTGVLLMMSEASKCYHSPAFWTKMGALVLAITFMTTVRRRSIARDAAEGSSMRLKVTAAVSLSLWLAVGICGRWIGFS